MSTSLFLRRAAGCLVAAAALVLPSCASWDGQIRLFGYTSAPNYDPTIHTVYVPIFQNVTYRRSLEFDLTKAVVREIELKTPWKVTSCRDGADTELLGKIVARTKSVTIYNNIGEVRGFQSTLTVELIWRDLRAGHNKDVLSMPKPRPTDPVPLDLPPIRETPVMVQSIASAIPELGQSLTTSEKSNVDHLAVQIVSMMEKPW